MLLENYLDKYSGIIYNTNMDDEIVIIDTNVLLSGLQSNQGQSFKILQKLLNEEISIGISVPLVLEYEKILKKYLDRKIFSKLKLL